MGSHDLIPSVFHRRLVLLAGLSVACMGVMAWRLGSLTLAKGGALRLEAESALMRRQWIPAARGRILDRKGRVLAVDRPSFDLAVRYDVITGQWSHARALRWAKRLSGHRWFDLSADERRERVAALEPVFGAHLDRAWDELARRAKISRSELDQRRDDVIAAVEGKHRTIMDFRRAQEEATFLDQGREISEPERRAIEKRVSRPIEEQESAHVLLKGVGDEVGFACLGLADDDVDLDLPPLTSDASEAARSASVERFPGLEVLDAGTREYPLETMDVELDRGSLPGPLRSTGPQKLRVAGVACHVIGRMREHVQAGDDAARTAALKADATLSAKALLDTGGSKPVDRGSYVERDRVGAAGLEYAQEAQLRGLRGLQSRRVDTGERSSLAPEPGRDVRLTLDIRLQALVQAAMSKEAGLAVVQPWQGQESKTQRPGDTLYGAAVVLDVDTSEILALVSTPTFTREQLGKDPKSIYGESVETLISAPGINKAVAKAYPPGSVVKALLFVEAVTQGVIPLDKHIECTGHLYADQPNKWRCWIYKRSNGAQTHQSQMGHALDGAEALMLSCNIFYFTVGRSLGVEGVVKAFRDFGVGDRYALGAGYEQAGQVGRRGKEGEGLTIFDATQMGIGQGPVTWTPLHAADAFATLARYGLKRSPRLLADAPKGQEHDLGLNPQAVDQALHGLRLSVEDERGTGHALTIDGVKEPIFNAPGVKIWGKTGTAAASPVVGDPDGEGPEPRQVLEAGDHSWYVVLVGRDRPQYAIAVVVDFGGSGGKVSGPIANQIVHALIAEGYL